MRYRKLRIAFSATCGIICLLLIGLWVRSYRLCDYVIRVEVGDQATTTIGSNYGTVYFLRVKLLPRTPDPAGFFPRTFSHRWKYLASDVQITPNTWPEWTSNPTGSQIRVPFWCLVIPSAALSAVPWIRAAKCRFSLRTLLIAMTLIAVGLGVIVAALG
jgi:hypothetical protein